MMRRAAILPTALVVFGTAMLAGVPAEATADAAGAAVRERDDQGDRKAEQRRRDLERRRAEEARRRAEDRAREDARRLAQERAREQARLRAEDGRRRAAARARIAQAERVLAQRRQQQDERLRDGPTTSAAQRQRRALASDPALRTLDRNTRAALGIDAVPSARYFRVHDNTGNRAAYYVTTIDRLLYRLAPRDPGPAFDPLNPYSGVVDVPAGLWTRRIPLND